MQYCRNLQIRIFRIRSSAAGLEKACKFNITSLLSSGRFHEVFSGSAAQSGSAGKFGSSQILLSRLALIFKKYLTIRRLANITERRRASDYLFDVKLDFVLTLLKIKGGD